jgi:hypothetical protein
MRVGGFARMGRWNSSFGGFTWAFTLLLLFFFVARLKVRLSFFLSFFLFCFLFFAFPMGGL